MVSWSVQNNEKTVLRSESGRWFARTALHERPDGVWVMAYTESDDHTDTQNNVIHISYSDDFGQTWTAEDTRLDGSSVSSAPFYPPGASTSDARGPGEPWLYPMPNGDLVMHTWSADYGTSNADGTWQIRSTDGGETWGAWEQITINGLSASENTWGFTTGDHIANPKGNGVLYATARNYNPGGFSNNTRNHLIKTTDNGATWDLVATPSSYAENTAEWGIEYLGNDKIIGVFNTKDRTDTYYSESTDMGETWSSLTSILSQTQMWDRPRLWTPSHVKDKHINAEYPEWWTDDVVFGIGDWEQDPGNGMNRVNALWVSDDGGATWSGPKTLDIKQEGTSSDKQDAGYGDMLYGADGRFVVISYQGIRPDCEIRMYEFDLVPSNKLDSMSLETTTSGALSTTASGAISTVSSGGGGGGATSKLTTESFEDGDMAEYSGDVSVFDTQSTTVHDGSYALESTPGSTNCLIAHETATLSQGDTFEWHQYTPIDGHLSGVAFGLQGTGGYTSNSGYYVTASGQNDEIEIWRLDGGSGTNLATTVTAGIPEESWNRFEVEWAGDGTITADLYDSAGTLVDSVSATDTTYTEGRVGFYAYETQYLDYLNYLSGSTTPLTAENFEDGDIAEYAGDTSAFTVQTGTAQEGTYALNADGASSNTLIAHETATLSQGDTFSWRQYTPAGNGAAGVAFGLQGTGGYASNSGYYVTASGQNDEIEIWRLDSGTNTNVATTVTAGIPTGAWNYFEVSWATDGTITADLYDSAGALVDSVSATDTTYTSGNVGFQSFESQYIDHLIMGTDKPTGPVTVIEGFEDGDITEYVGDTAQFSVQSTTGVTEGSNALEGLTDSNGTGARGIATTSYTTQEGNTYRCDIELPDTNGRAIVKFGAQSATRVPNCYRCDVRAYDDTIALVKHDGTGDTTIDSAAVTVSNYLNQTLTVEFDWQADGTLTFNLLDSAGTQIGTVAGSDTTYTSGGIGFMSDGGSSATNQLAAYYDNLRSL